MLDTIWGVCAALARSVELIGCTMALSIVPSVDHRLLWIFFRIHNLSGETGELEFGFHVDLPEHKVAADLRWALKDVLGAELDAEHSTT